MTDNKHSKEEERTPQVPAYSYDLLRHELLPELLGNDETVILYWAGKSIARNKMSAIESLGIENFFKEANWGKVQPAKEKRNERIYELEAPHQNSERPFSLEAGFLAQLLEMEKGVVSEASWEIKRKKPLTAAITVRWDKKDPSNPEGGV
ncbi:DUF2507 domain-containing protein [Salipaludibacillus aurantiacus]|uniref:DUF2507 domain-containing protein n=1 Tax=Salipaludibacillus aurantiacus TaxID=1601833 RepID=A0A1H9T1K1_9BACI|nr:DUF2507 domain-containing protein [Salipaludibacillus aurantiacus]SER90947.1 Protein of unknown function [Salipaludibacillus aurantiacus]